MPEENKMVENIQDRQSKSNEIYIYIYFIAFIFYFILI